MAARDNMSVVLDQRRRALGMSVPALARRCGLGVSTVRRALAGGANERIGTLHRIASALGMRVMLRSVDTPDGLRQKTAKLKARAIVRRTQASFALEGQAAAPGELAKVGRVISRKLLSSRLRLWS